MLLVNHFQKKVSKVVGVLLLWVCCDLIIGDARQLQTSKLQTFHFLYERLPTGCIPNCRIWNLNDFKNWRFFFFFFPWEVDGIRTRHDLDLNSYSISMYCRWRTKPFFLCVFHDTRRVVLKGLWTGRRVESLRWRLSRTPFRCLLAGQCAVWLPSSALRSNHNRKHLDGL